MRARSPRGPVVTDLERLRLRRLRRARLRARGERFRITHAGSFFGQARPASVPDRPGTGGRRPRALRRRLPRRLTANGRPGSPTASSSSPTPRTGASLELQRDSEALLLLIPDAGRPRPRDALRQGVRVPGRRPADPRRSCRPTGPPPSFYARPAPAVVVAPDDIDGIERELTALRDRCAGRRRSRDAALDDEWRRKLSRRSASRSSRTSCELELA